MKKQVLFIQGAGAGAYEGDKELAASLQDSLGEEYDVVCPRMPNEENPEAGPWMAQITKELSAFKEYRYSFITAVMMKSYHLRIWRPIPKKFQERPFVNLMGAGINLMTIYLKLPQI